jgi:thiol:disulfide interchange protein DsbG
MIKARFLLAPVATALLASAAMAQTPAETGAQTILTKLSHGQAKVKKTFAGPAGSGLTGLVVDLGQPGREMIAYTTSNGKYMIVGGVFDASGKNYSLAAMQQYLPPPPPPPNAAKNFASLKDTHTYVWGQASAKKEIWFLEDPDCIWCHRLFDALSPAVNSGEVKVHVIQAGFLKPDSLAKAAAIMASKDPAAALVEDETKFNVSAEEGGITGSLKDAKAVAEVKANNAWMQSHGVGGTPYVLYKDVHGQVQVVPGMPSDVSAMLAQVGPAGK